MRICAKTEENNDEIQLVLRVRELSLHLQMWLEHGVLGSVRGRQYGRSRASDGLLGLLGLLPEQMADALRSLTP